VLLGEVVLVEITLELLAQPRFVLLRRLDDRHGTHACKRRIVAGNREHVSSTFEPAAGCFIEGAMKELAPTGKLRVGVVFAPFMSTFFVLKEADGTPRGVTVDLGAALAKKLNLPLEYVLYPNSGQATDAVEAGSVDVSFMPVDEERRKRIAFGPDYVRAESTYMVTAGSGAKTVADVDRAGMRVIGIAKHHHDPRRNPHPEEHDDLARDPRSAMRSRCCATARRTRLHSGATRCLPTSRRCRARALPTASSSRSASRSRCKRESRRRSRAVSEFMNEAKTNGTVRKALDKGGFDDPVAP